MKWIGQHIWSFISRFRSDVYLESVAETAQDHVVGIDADGKLYKQDVSTGDITGVTAGTGLSGGGTSGAVTLNVEASQTQVTAVGVIATGQWRATDIGVAYGGTGLSTVGTNEILTGNGVGALTSESTLTYDSETLTIGVDDDGAAIIQRANHSDGEGGDFYIKAGSVTDEGATNTVGGDLHLSAGAGTGSGRGGSIHFNTHAVSATASSATDLNTVNQVAVIDSGGNLQIDGDLTVSGNDIKDSGGNSIISSNGSGVVTMAGGNISVGGTNANLEMNAGSDIILEADNAGGGGASSIQYKDSGGGNKIMLAANSDVVILSNRASNGTVQVRANTSTAGSGGEVTVATFEDDKVTISQDLDVAGTIRSGITYIKILPSDFIADDGGRPLAIDDTTSDRWLESNGTNPMFASVEIPAGFKATHVDIYGSGTSAITVYEADVNSRTVTSKGTGNIGTQIDITDVTADATNYLLIAMMQASGEQVNGGKVTIAAV